MALVVDPVECRLSPSLRVGVLQMDRDKLDLLERALSVSAEAIPHLCELTQVLRVFLTSGGRRLTKGSEPTSGSLVPFTWSCLPEQSLSTLCGQQGSAH